MEKKITNRNKPQNNQTPQKNKKQIHMHYYLTINLNNFDIKSPNLAQFLQTSTPGYVYYSQEFTFKITEIHIANKNLIKDRLNG